MQFFSFVLIVSPGAPFHLHSELAYRVMMALNSSTRSDPDIRIELPFDYYLFCGGLRQAGYLIKKNDEVYGIKRYSTLSPMLGEQWHLRVLNRQKDFCYAMLETVQFYLYRREPIITSFEPLRTMDGGHMLVFKFVRGDGVQRHYDDIVNMQ